MSVHLLEEVEQLCCRVPITDGHGLIGWRTDNFVETAFCPLSAETLGIDHTITWPDMDEFQLSANLRKLLDKIAQRSAHRLGMCHPEMIIGPLNHLE
jgi:hypothetical protein